MKKLSFLLTLMLLTLGIGSAWAAEVTINFGYSNWDGVTASFSGNAKDEVTQTVDGVVVTYTRNGASLYANNTALRFYKSNTLKFDAPSNYSITSITFTCTSFQTDITSNSGTCTATSSALSWTGDASSVTFTRPLGASSYATITKATVTLTSAGGETPEPGTGGSANVTYDFTKIEGLSSWGSSYSEHIVTYSDAKVTFEAASKQTSNVTDCPVTKGKYVTLVMTDGSTLSSVEWVCKQWTTKTQTITLHYSTDGGNTYTSTGVTSTNFTISSNNLPTGTNAVKITFSNSSNQVGISSCTITKVTSDEPQPVIVKTLKSIAVTPTTTTYEQGDVFSFDGTCTATYSVTKDGVAQEDETKEVTPTSVSTPDMSTTGDKVVTVSYTESEVTVETTYTITVTENTIVPGTYPGNLNNVFFGCSVGNNAEEQSGKLEDILVVSGCTQSAQTKTSYQSDHVRYYADNYVKFSAPAGYLISAIQFTAYTGSFKWDGEITATVGTYDADGKSWTGSAKEVQFNFGKQNRIASVSVTYAEASKYALTITTPSNGTLTVKEGENAVATGDKFYASTQLTVTATPEVGYKLASVKVADGSSNDVTASVYDNGTLTMPEYDVTISATFEAAKTLTSIEITTPATQTTFWQGETFNSTGLVVTAHFDGAADEVVTPTVTGSTATAGTQTVTVSFTEGTVTKSTTYNITVKAIPNTKETAYSVADAYDIIDKLTTAEGVFISGIISQVDSYNSTYKSITYWISADGTTTNQLQAYSGKGLESADFTTVTDLTVGDQVIICGNLKKYDSTYEFDKNNYLVEYTPTTKDPAGLVYATTEYTANVGEDFVTPVLTNPNNLTVTYSTSDASKATVDANTGAVTIVAAGEVTITASTKGDATHDAGSASYTITISDPALAVAQLPFAFDGKQADIANTPGMSHEGIDASDYGSSPYLKMNTTGDWLVIRFDSEPEKLTYDIKNNSFSGGTFTVQESADGETYTDVAVHTTIEGTQNEEHTLLSTSRYVKFVYTNKSTGNVGLGNIKITKLDLRAEVNLSWTPTSVTLTQGDAFTAPTLSYPNSITGITYETSDDQVATVTSDGVIALAGATGSATITATFAGDGNYKPATATCTITVLEYIETLDGEWQLVTDASKLQAGMEIIIASVADAGTVKTMGEQGNNNRSAVASTVDGDKLNPAVGTTVITLEDCQLYEGLFALKTKDGYLYAAGSSSNHLKSQEGINNNACWTITITEGVAAVVATNSSNRNIMRYNETSDLFSCYASGQKDIALYAKKPAHTRTTSAGRYGTICLPGNIVKCLGATLYEVAGKDGKKVIFDEVLTPEAGIPYIFLAHNTEVLFFCGDQTAAAGNRNSLYGTFTVMQDAQLDGMYMVQNNKIVKCAATGCGVAENRAYFNGTELEGLGAAPAAMPGRRRVTMGTSAENTTTGTEDVVSPTDNVIKKIVDGQLIIIRGGEKFNAQGQRL